MKGISMVLIVLMIVAMMPVGTATANYGPTQPSNVTLYTYLQDGHRVVSTEMPLYLDGGVIVTPANFGPASDDFNGSIKQHRIDLWRANHAE